MMVFYIFWHSKESIRNRDNPKDPNNRSHKFLKLCIMCTCRKDKLEEKASEDFFSKDISLGYKG